MSHLIIKPQDRVYVPKNSKFSTTWHGLEDFPTTGDAIANDGANIPHVLFPVVQCGVKPDFDSPISDCPPDLMADMGESPLSAHKLILADMRANTDENGKSLGVFPLHVPKKGYQIHQNREIFASMVAACKEVLGADGFEIATVGTLGAGSQFFVSILVKGALQSFTIGKGKGKLADAWECFFQFVSSHNGLVASMSLLDCIRIVCMNTVKMACDNASENGTASIVKHTVNSLELITPQALEANLRQWTSQREAFVNALNSLLSVSMTPDQFKSFAAGIFTSEESDELSTNSYNRVEEMTALFIRGKGNVGETAYDAVNAFTEYFTSGNGVGSKKVTASKRLANANFGKGNDWKNKAIKVAASVEGFESLEDCIKRGQILYNDKLIAMTTTGS